jgi:hypothetical protein
VPTVADRFAALQEGLVARPPAARRTVVAIPSLNLGPDYQARHDTTALEERWLYLALGLRDPRVRVVAVTSLPVPRASVDHYLALLADPEDARTRLTLLSPDDPSPRPLAEKLLDRPALLDALRAAAGDPADAVIVPFAVEGPERELALALGIPVDGVDPRFAILGGKSEGRRVLREVGVPFGTEGGHGDARALADVIGRLRGQRPGLAGVVVKLDRGSLGEGNAIVDLTGLPGPRDPEATPATVRRVDETLDPAFRAALATQPWVVEELVPGARERSPSVQLRIEPDAGVTILSTHDQRLDGPLGQTFAGARFPADDAHGPAVAEAGRRVGASLAARGVRGRLAVDFVVGADGTPLAVEINLREGATTHPYGTLALLVGGGFDAATNVYRAADGAPRYYEASDRLTAGPVARPVDPEAFLTALREAGLAFDPRTGAGVVPHMLRALGGQGTLSLVAIGRSREEAAALYARTGALLGRLGA